MEPWEAKNLVEVVEEGFEHGVIYWFHWPYDGPRFLSSREDYEPVAVIKGGVKLAARPHFTLTWTDDVKLVDGVPAAIFITPWHHPIIRRPVVERALRVLGRLVMEADYQPRPGFIPRWFRTAGLKIDFRDYAVEVGRDPLNKGLEPIFFGLADFAELARIAGEAIRLLDSGNFAGSIELCRSLIAELEKKGVYSDLAGFVKPYVDYVEEHGLPPSEEAVREFADYLKKDLGYLRLILEDLAGEQ